MREGDNCRNILPICKGYLPFFTHLVRYLLITINRLSLKTVKLVLRSEVENSRLNFFWNFR